MKNIRNTRTIKKKANPYQPDPITSGSANKKLRIFMLLAIALFIVLVLRIAWIEFIDGDEFRADMNKQLSTSKVISTKRGKIYDTNGKALAISAKVDTVTINPNLIRVVKNKAVDEEKTKALKEKVSKAFSDIF